MLTSYHYGSFDVVHDLQKKQDWHDLPQIIILRNTNIWK